ncbi:AI-2E family transporter [Geomobilimonas luticola]|uniref:AI-2E family transporter n=1 Tax=Geomobilimonas luticola TaxID=1114878 RepID=A0ABS5SDU8_9BACT|nr:AI-2E family transporter [Geomobilimonas luticola]MBT0652679.1 AI-2E family transporter [Geomobilimonas luticola]
MDSVGAKGRMYYFLAGCFVLALLASIFIRHTFSALLTSLALAYLLNPLLKYLEKRGFSRSLSITFMYGIIALVALYSSFFLIPYIGHQLNALTSALPDYVQGIKQALDDWKDELLPYYSAADLDWLMAKIQGSLNKLATDVSGMGYEQLKGILFALFDLLLAPILVFFMLYYKEEFKDILLRITPREVRKELKQLGNRINRTLERFVLAMVVDCLLVGILCAAALALLDIEFPLLNGMFAGFATIVPFVGALVAVIPPALIGYAKSGDILIIPKVCAIYFLINVVVDGYIIKPLVMRGTLRLNPLAVIFSVMALGEIMGFWGIVLAIPCAAVVKVCSTEVRQIMASRNDHANDDL